MVETKIKSSKKNLKNKNTFIKFSSKGVQEGRDLENYAIVNSLFGNSDVISRET